MTANRTLVRMEAHVWTKLIHTSAYAKKAGREKSAASVCTISIYLYPNPYLYLFKEIFIT
jgi:hypothetical protein